MSLIQLSAATLLRNLRDKQVSAEEVTRAYLDRISAHDAEIGAFLRVDADAALDTARGVDQRRARGEALGALAGIPVAIKDALCTQGEPTTCGSRMLENYRPPYDATVVAKLKAADAVFIGKTNMDEFAMGSSTENSAYRTTRNPWDISKAPGGSSGGAAACVAAGMAPLSIGTDTGGSIRQPAAFCGVAGCKPTYGRVSRFGLVAFASSLDQVGPLAKNVGDLALLMSVIAGHDPHDSTSLDRPVDDYAGNVDRPLENLRLGVVKEHFAAGLNAEVETAVRDAIAVFESLGAEIKEVSLRHSKYAIATYYVIAPSEASSNLARYDGVHYGYRTNLAEMMDRLEGERKAAAAAGLAEHALDTPLVRMYRDSRGEAFGDEVKRRIMLGTYALSAGYYDAYYLKALQVRRLIRQDFDEAFREVDLLVGPVTPNAAFGLGDMIDDPLAMYLGDLYTVSANLAGIPAISLPCGFTAQEMPIGLQIQAPPLEESRLLRGARMFELATNWHEQYPNIA